MRYKFKIKNFLIVFLIFFLSASAFTDNEQLPPRDILEKMVYSIIRVKTIRAYFSFTDESGTGMEGLLRYWYPGRIRLDLSEPAGKKIVTNGKYLWVYDESRKVAGRQNLSAKSLSGGLKWLRGYEEVTAIPQLDGHILQLRSKKRRWKTVTVRMGSDYIPLSIVMDNDQGSTQTLTLSDIKTGQSFMGKIFDFRFPGSVQLIENPLNLK